jgi:hypothetical protein
LQQRDGFVFPVRGSEQPGDLRAVPYKRTSGWS